MQPRPRIQTTSKAEYSELMTRYEENMKGSAQGRKGMNDGVHGLSAVSSAHTNLPRPYRGTRAKGKH